MSGRFQKIFVGSNLKMHKTIQQTLAFSAEMEKLTREISRQDLELFFLPSYTALPDLCRVVDHSLIKVGAQNMHWEEAGAFTGEISPAMLQEIGIDLVMVGHAERRQLFGETDWMVNKRVRASLAHNFQTLVCIGDTMDEKEYGVTAERLTQQLKIALHNVDEGQLERVWVAYEPVWAIGDWGIVAEPSFANRMHASIHATLAGMYPGCRVPVLYGGSVNLDNAAELISQPDIDGLFIGRAAWDSKHFIRIIRRVLGLVTQTS